MAHFTAMMQREKSFGYLVGVHSVGSGRWISSKSRMVRRQITQRLLGAEHDVIAVGNVVANGVLSARRVAIPHLLTISIRLRRCGARFSASPKGSLTLIIAIDIGVIDGGYA
ncbi:Uncharacterised protein [Klebsiella pneumoniae]|uniref:Uncharacterized protein n=1 Tax=Klebsiella pneumoniae TaxID=573 RepID=A0A378B2J5_KLEPN|nr:Uncharacterised protein [Klebsiella pneumoniae]